MRIDAKANEAFSLAQSERQQAARKVAVERITNDMNTLSHVLNIRRRYSINKELNRVVVKMLDSATDRVIREIPPAELQRLYVRVREAVERIVS